MNDNPIRDESIYPHNARLIVLSKKIASRKDPIFSLADNLTIDFPSNQESIDMARSAEYDVGLGSPIPDGIHVYKYTSPMSIPFSFSLHYTDRLYCPEGALTLLKIASRVHALVLPIGDLSDFDSRINLPNTGNSEEDIKNRAEENSRPSYQSFGEVKIRPPAACRLEFMYTTSDGPGIVYNGYVKDVSVKLKAPFMRGSGNSFNLPSAIDVSFNFVHRPGYSNSYSFSGNTSFIQTQAGASFIKEKFYNTASLTYNNDFIGF